MQTYSLKKLINEAPVLFIASSALFLVLTLFRYVIIPQYYQFTMLQKEHTRYRERISSESDYALIKEEITDKIAILENKLHSSGTTSSMPHDAGSFLEELISVARKADIRFVKMQPQEESRSEEYTYYPVLLDLTTTYHALGQFLSSLEMLPHLYRVDRLAINTVPTGKCSVKLLITSLIPQNSIDPVGVKK